MKNEKKLPVNFHLSFIVPKSVIGDCSDEFLSQLLLILTY
jgi:hypothetical protein